MADELDVLEGERRPTRRWLRWSGFSLSFIVGLVLVYYIGGALLIQNVDDDISFGTASSAPEGGSHAVAVTADLVEREVDVNRWTPNDPFFLPAYILDNMPNFQEGIVDASARFINEMRDHVARTRGSSPIDKDLEEAAGALRYPPRTWYIDFKASWGPTSAADQQYRAAVRALRSYNARLANGNAVFDRRADNLQVVLDRVAQAVGAASARLYEHIQDHGNNPFDLYCDNVFYRVKGEIYAYTVILRALGEDFRQVIETRDMTEPWAQTIATLEEAAKLQPIFVFNGMPDSMLLPAHLAGQGFYVLRARTQLRELTSILQT